MPVITFNLNGNPVSVNADKDEELQWVLRDRLNMNGVKYGCGMGLCGVCTSHIDGVAKRQQRQLLEDSAEHSLRLVPALLRPAVRKVLFG